MGGGVGGVGGSEKRHNDVSHSKYRYVTLPLQILPKIIVLAWYINFSTNIVMLNLGCIQHVIRCILFINFSLC